MTPIVSTEWLAERIGIENLSVIDATWFMPGSMRDARAEYAARHIPGAVFFDIDAVSDQASDLPHMLPAPVDFTGSVRRLGIDPGDVVVVYDGLGVFSAPRVWWSFRAMGHDNIAVLDGGLPKWISDGRPTEDGWREPSPGSFKAKFNPKLVRNLEQVRALVDAGNHQIIDARPAGRFTGETEEPRPGLRSGHMPGARSLPYSMLLKANGTMADSPDLLKAFEAAGIDLMAPVVATCGSGISASVLALGLAILGQPDTAVYDGSWTEWAARSETPIVQGVA